MKIFEKIFRWFSRIRGFSTPFGGISWSDTKTKFEYLPRYTGFILITSGSNDELISFLEMNCGRIVILDTTIDASVSTLEEIDFVKKNDIDIDPFTSGGNGIYPLRNTLGELIDIKFHLTPNHVLNFSHGGTGVVTVAMNGFFEISKTFHGGPTILYHLNEIEVSLEARIELINRSSKVV